MKSNGKPYKLSSLKSDQTKVMLYIITQLRQLYYNPETFMPVRMTIMGTAGSGKSTLINTLITIIRNMFQCENSVIVGAPTGVAAYNASGATNHHVWNINQSNEAETTISDYVKDELIKQFKSTVMIILDERSMISSSVLGRMERVTRHTMHGGIYTDKSWGNVPFVLLFGDDSQLPSVEPGAHNIGSYTRMCSTNKNKQLGEQQFLDLSDCTMKLTKIKRQHKSDNVFKRFLKKLRSDKVKPKDVEMLRKYHVDNIDMKSAQDRVKQQDTIFVAATNETKDKINLEQLHKTHSATNPVAKIQPTSTGKGKHGKGIYHHFKNHKNDVSTMNCLSCINAKMSIAGKNFKPSWFLFNGAQGLCVEIDYPDSSNPNNNDDPNYIVLEMKSYCGPVWDKKNPKVNKFVIEIPLSTSNGPHTNFCFQISTFQYQWRK